MVNQADLHIDIDIAQMYLKGLLSLGDHNYVHVHKGCCPTIFHQLNHRYFSAYNDTALLILVLQLEQKK